MVRIRIVDSDDNRLGGPPSPASSLELSENRMFTGAYPWRSSSLDEVRAKSVREARLLQENRGTDAFVSASFISRRRFLGQSVDFSSLAALGSLPCIAKSFEGSLSGFGGGKNIGRTTKYSWSRRADRQVRIETSRQ